MSKNNGSVPGQLTLKKKRGRPRGSTLLTQTRFDVLVRSVREGLSREGAAALVGISTKTFYSWLKRAREEHARIVKVGGNPLQSERIFLDLLQAINEADAAFEQTMIGHIVAAAPESWQAAAWALERKFWKKYAKRTRTELTGADGGPIGIQASRAGDDEFRDVGDRDVLARYRAALESIDSGEQGS